jgi:hypothetical protein
MLMNKREKAKAVDTTAVEVPITDSLSTFPLSPGDPLARIRMLGQRIDGYIQFMCDVGRLNGSSAEAKNKAVTVFCERLAAMEQELGRIQEELQLG